MSKTPRPLTDKQALAAWRKYRNARDTAANTQARARTVQPMTMTADRHWETYHRHCDKADEAAKLLDRYFSERTQ